MTDINEILLRITGDDDDAKRSLEDIITLLSALGAEEADPNVELKGEKEALAGIFALVAALEVLDKQDVNVDVEVDRDGAARTAATGLMGIFERLGSSFADSGSGLAGLTFNIGPLVGRLNAANAAILAVVAAIGTSLVGAIGALVASLAAAVAGVFALASAFAAALGPIVLLAVGVFAKLGQVMKLVQAQDQASLAQSQKNIQGHTQRAAAADREKQAAEQLASANEALGKATKQAYREMADAAEAARDAVLGLESAQLNQKQANLDYKQARLELAKFRNELGLTGAEADAAFKKFTDVNFNPAKLNSALAKLKAPNLGGDQALQLQQLILNVQKARLGEKEATDGVSDAVTTLTRAREKEAEFQSKGIAASDQYTAALQAQRQAAESLAAAKKDPGIEAAMAKQLAMQQEATDTENQLADAIRRVRDLFKTAFAPVTDAVLQGLIDGLKKLPALITPLQPLFRALGQVAGAAIRDLFDAITSPKGIKAFQAFTIAAIQLGADGFKGIKAIATIFFNIAKVSLPAMAKLFGAFVDSLGRVAGKTNDTKALGDLIGVLVRNLNVWLSIIGSLSGAFLGFLIAAQPFGEKLAEAIATTARHLAEWANSKDGREEIKLFLTTAVPLFLSLAKLVGRIVVLLIRIGEVVTPLVILFVEGVSTMIEIVNDLLKPVAVLAAAFTKVAVAVSRAMEIIYTTLSEAVKDVLTFAVEIGVSLVEGIIKGIGDIGGAIWKKVKNGLGDVIGKAKKFLGINSPSKVFMRLGVGVTEGFVKGLDNTKELVGKAAVRAIAVPTINVGDKLPGTLRSPAIAAAAGGSAGTVIEKQEINLPAAPGYDQMGDPRHQAILLARELRRRGH